MAMLNFIQEGSYTKISGINWDRGRVGSVRLETYETTPDWTYAQLQDLAPEGDDEASLNWREETAASLMFSEITAEQCSSFTADLSKSLWSQMYVYLHTLSMFSGTVNDED